MKVASLALVLVAFLAAPFAHAQTYKAPRTSFGHPSLEGVWNSLFITPFEARPDTPNLVVSEAESKAMAIRIAQEIGRYTINDQDPEVGGLFWFQSQNGMGLVKGERRTRQLVLPTDGKLPVTRQARGEITFFDNLLQTGSDFTGLTDNPEQRPNWERCIALQGQPPIAIVNGGNPRLIVHTKDHVIIQAEYEAGTRIIPFAAEHGPAYLRTALGDAIARWEGETLVVETIGMPAKDRVRLNPTFMVGAASTVIEKFTRVAENEVLYQYTVVDPAIYTAPWLAEYSLYPQKEQPIEFACHEGNYAMEHILRGARQGDAAVQAAR